MSPVRSAEEHGCGKRSIARVWRAAWLGRRQGIEMVSMSDTITPLYFVS